MNLNGRPQQSPARSALEFVARNRWLVAGVPVVMLLATLAFVNWVTPVYRGVASVRIDEERSNIAVIDALKELSQGASIYTEIAELRSRSVAESVVDSLALQLRMASPRRTPRSEIFSALRVERDARPGAYRLERGGDGAYTVQGGAGPARTVPAGGVLQVPGATLTLRAGLREEQVEFEIVPFQVAVREFRNTIAVSRPEREADVVEIAFETTDQVLAREVPNTMAALFIARRQNVKTQEARGTISFLDDQLDTLGGQLRGLENGLRQFREGASIINPEAEGEAQVNRLARFQAERDMVEAEYRSLSSLFNEVRDAPVAPAAPSPYRRLLGFPTLLLNPGTSQLLSSLNEIENERAQLLTRLTPQDPDVQILTGRVRELESQLEAITATYLQGLSNRMTSLTALLNRNAADLQRIPAKEIEYARLLRQAKVTEEIFTELQSRRKEAQIIAAVQDPSVRVMDPAIMPIGPIKPNKPFNIALALVLGLAIGLAAGFMRETLDTTIHTRDELQHESGSVPVLGTIPRIREKGVAGVNGDRVWWRMRPATVQLSPELRKSRLVAGRNPRGAASEAYRTLRTNIAFARPEKPAKTMVFTSPAPGEGKSTSSSNLAITLAQQGLRAILIDADMRRGAIHEAFETSQRPGLSDYLLGGVALEEVIRNVVLEGAPFDFIPTGTLPPNPAELLASARMQALLEHLDGEYDAVIFDAPPLNVVTDAAILGSRADGVIVVARAGITDRSALRYALSQLEGVHARVLGCVLNDVDTRRERYHGAYVDDRYYEVNT